MNISTRMSSLKCEGVTSPSYTELPQFFFASPKHETLMQRKVFNMAHVAQLEKWRELLSTTSELKETEKMVKEVARNTCSVDVELLQNTLEDKQKDSKRKEEKERIGAILSTFNSIRESLSSPKINYTEFCALQTKVPYRTRRYFTSTIFLQFPRDQTGCICVNAFTSYFTKMNSNLERFLSLSLYDTEGRGYLDEKSLSSFLSDLISTFPGLSEKVSKAFQPFYLKGATRIFFFLLDAKKTGKLYLKDLLGNALLDDLFSLEEEKEEKIAWEKNWFHPKYAERLYCQYLQLDKDKNGLLSGMEFLRFGKAKAFRKGSKTSVHDFTNVFVTRIFEECVTYPPENEMDYNGFLDFVLAMQYLETKSGFQYFWRILDIHKSQTLDAFTVSYFLRPILARMKELSGTVMKLDVVCNELFDMIKPEQAGIITMNDLQRNTAMGTTLIRVLTDFNAFLNYEHRTSRIPFVEENSRDASWPWGSES